tara:strand:+ start:181 stop:363 length:183 start_codon:yes stop_codon:yes gene_type:complete
VVQPLSAYVSHPRQTRTVPSANADEGNWFGLVENFTRQTQAQIVVHLLEGLHRIPLVIDG